MDNARLSLTNKARLWLCGRVWSCWVKNVPLNSVALGATGSSCTNFGLANFSVGSGRTAAAANASTTQNTNATRIMEWLTWLLGWPAYDIRIYVRKIRDKVGSLDKLWACVFSLSVKWLWWWYWASAIWAFGSKSRCTSLACKFFQFGARL